MDRFNKIWTTGLAGGLTAAGLIIILEVSKPSTIGIITYAAIYILLVAVAFVFHIIAHEGGHCIGGLLSGYEFTSFRVFDIVIVKRDGKYLRKKFHMVGTGGQCLMAPPQPYRPDYPYKLYNLAGGLTNLIIAALCIALTIPVLSSEFDSGTAGGPVSGLPGGLASALALLILLPLITAGIFCGITNLVPMIIGGVTNDGWNLTHLGKDPISRRILWLLLDVMAIINRGGQFRDMPEDWFELNAKPAEASEPNPARVSDANPARVSDANPDFGNSFQCALAVYRFNYLVDTGRFQEAEALAQQILDAGAKVMQLYRYEITCEAIFLELIGQRRLARVERLYTPELERYIKATASYPHRQRLHYAMAMLYFRDDAPQTAVSQAESDAAEVSEAESDAAERSSKAVKALELFTKACKTYPNDGEISSEWELIGLVDCKLAEINAMTEQVEEEAASADG